MKIKYIVFFAAILFISEFFLTNYTYATALYRDGAGCGFDLGWVRDGNGGYALVEIYDGTQTSGGIGPCPGAGFEVTLLDGICPPNTGGNWAWLTGTLNDTYSSNLSYVFGDLAVNHGGTIDSLVVSVGNLSTTFLTSSSFTLGSSDVLNFVRLMGFDDNLSPDLSNWLNLSTSQKDSLAMVYSSIMSSKEVSPTSSEFSSSSYVRYILELVRTSDNVCLQVLDTLKAFTNGSGQLQFVTHGNTNDKVTTALTTSYSGTNAYLRVRVISSLAGSGSLTLTAFRFGRDYLSATAPDAPGFRQVIGSSAKIASSDRGENILPISLNISQPVPNPTSNLIRITVEADQQTEANLQIFEILGKTVINKTITISKGKQNYSVDVSGLATGRYYLSIIAGETKQSFAIDILR